ncbi:MAG: LysM peptidoglycan-binding domain-containing protein [Pseudomonadota bacterium]
MKRSALIAVALLLLVGVAAALYYQYTDGPAPSVAKAVPSNEGPVEPDQTAETEPALAPSVDEAIEPPSFDIVRVEPSGDTVMAGRAVPGSKVEVLDGEETIGETTAGPTGEWVLVPEAPLGPGSHELSLRATSPAGGNPETIPFASTEKEPSPVTEIAESDPVEDGLSSGPASVASKDVVLVTVPDRTNDGLDEIPDTPVAVLASKDGEGATRILQGPGEGIIDHDLVLNAVDYDLEGRVTISGLATPGATLVVYLDNEALGQLTVGVEGHWLYKVTQVVLPGLHTLRIDMIGADGSVVARVETPFERSSVVADLKGKGFVVVQPGNSLWRIARRTYGRGLHFTVIHQANNDQIGDPHLIYPGQIFVLPKVN